LPTYESGKTPVDIQMIIMNFETVMTQDIIPDVLGIPYDAVPPKTVRFKSF
jgi:hypothetical protein